MRSLQILVEYIILLQVVLRTFNGFPGKWVGNAWDYGRSFSSCPSGVEEKVIATDSIVLSLTPFILQFRMMSDAVTLCELAEMSILVDDYIEASVRDQLRSNNTVTQIRTAKTELVAHSHGDEVGQLILEFETLLAFDAGIVIDHDVHFYDMILQNSFHDALQDFMALISYLPEENFFQDTEDVAFAFAPLEERTSARMSQGSTSIITRRFHLEYRISDVQSPSALDILAVEKLTNSHLQTVMMEELQLTPALIRTFSTDVISHTVSTDWIDTSFEISIDLMSDSPVQISARSVDEARKQAFLDENLLTYTELLNGLPKSNVFSHTLLVRNDQTGNMVDDTPKILSWLGENLIVWIILGIGVVITLTGTTLYKFPNLLCCCGGSQRPEKKEIIVVEAKRRRHVIRQRKNRAAKAWDIPSRILAASFDDCYDDVDDELDQRTSVPSCSSREFDVIEDSLPRSARPIRPDSTFSFFSSHFTLRPEHDIVLQDEMTAVSSVTGVTDVLREFNKKKLRKEQKAIPTKRDQLTMVSENKYSRPQVDQGDDKVDPTLDQGVDNIDSPLVREEPGMIPTNHFDPPLSAVNKDVVDPPKGISGIDSLRDAINRKRACLIDRFKNSIRKSGIETNDEGLRQEPTTPRVEQPFRRQDDDEEGHNSAASLRHGNLKFSVTKSTIPTDDHTQDIRSKSSNPFDDDDDW